MISVNYSPFVHYEFKWDVTASIKKITMKDMLQDHNYAGETELELKIYMVLTSITALVCSVYQHPGWFIHCHKNHQDTLESLEVRFS